MSESSSSPSPAADPAAAAPAPAAAGLDVSGIAPRTALIAGATGAVGRPLLIRLLNSPRYGTVKALVRRPLGFVHPRLVELKLQGGDPATLGADALAADDVFCCLGTTLKQAGSKPAFERVDYHLVVELARAAKAAGAQQFLVVSAAGSSPKALAFYSRVKARMEQAVAEIGFAAVHAVRPSLLLAERRHQPRRLGEELAQKLARALDPLLTGSLAKYRAVKAEHVADALLHLAERDAAGLHVHHLPLEAEPAAAPAAR